MIMLLCLACSGSDGGNDEPDVKEPTQLEIHVYTPEHPVVTRTDLGAIEPDEEEKKISSLHIWVFVSEDKGSFHVGDFVGYLNPQVTSPSSPSSSAFEGTYQMTVSEEFADKKPRVDVYVMANVTSTMTGFTLDDKVTVNQLNNVKIQHSETSDLYGITSPVTTTPPTEGLTRPQRVLVLSMIRPEIVSSTAS